MHEKELKNQWQTQTMRLMRYAEMLKCSCPVDSCYKARAGAHLIEILRIIDELSKISKLIDEQKHKVV